MRMSVREAKARFSEAISAAQKGESVLITKNGAPVAKLVAATGDEDGETPWDRMTRVRHEMGLDKVHLDLPTYFNDAAFSRRVLGLEE